jgi:phosphoribosyl 1,2-cyclic phosphodiesterase
LLVRVTILGSGSEGNALLFESPKTSVLVDAGLSHRRLVQRFGALGRTPPKDVSALIITHSHADHAAHASTCATRLHCQVRASEETLGSIRLGRSVPATAFSVGRRFRIGDITVHSLRIPHDAPQAALAFETKDTKVGLITDLGSVPRGLSRFLSDCETVLLESNHDAEMLASGPYPLALKRRVGGPLGHLSNEQSGDLLASLRHAPSLVVLMHLSETNNSAQLARSSAQAALPCGKTKVLVAHQRHPLELGAVHGSQLRLAL